MFSWPETEIQADPLKILAQQDTLLCGIMKSVNQIAVKQQLTEIQETYSAGSSIFFLYSIAAPNVWFIEVKVPANECLDTMIFVWMQRWSFHWFVDHIKAQMG